MTKAPGKVFMAGKPRDQEAGRGPETELPERSREVRAVRADQKEGTGPE